MADARSIIEAHALADAICCCTEGDDLRVSAQTVNEMAAMLRKKLEGMMEAA